MKNNKFFDFIHGNFGFGCMRLPMVNGEVDTAEFTRMVDTYLEAGFNYFDTAHGYLDGKSETAIRECLTSRYPRDKFILTDKLSSNHFNKQEDIRPLLEQKLAACGVEYFDFYLMHAQGADNYGHYQKCKAYETALEFKAEGKIRHFGISFHDKAEVLEKILTDHPEIEVVQLQFNYVDYNDVSIDSRRCYETCVKYGKPVIVMEPVKGGMLVNLPDEAQKVFDDLKGGSNASYAIRFAASHDNIMIVLSGMSNMEQMQDNLSFMKDFQPLSDAEQEAVAKVCEIFRSQNTIACTACRYCMERCPQNIPIPALFACLNSKRKFNNFIYNIYYNKHVEGVGKAGDCLKCGKCEKACPQHLPIRDLLVEVAAEFEQ